MGAVPTWLVLESHPTSISKDRQLVCINTDPTKEIVPGGQSETMQLKTH